ncbi:unnamed protein product [Caenorhabditis sp. 36 PRJEB53466]|nr:unnamed protein product [Caenorhabditis sp. 36 PRJEB53466]
MSGFEMSRSLGLVVSIPFGCLAVFALSIFLGKCLYQFLYKLNSQANEPVHVLTNNTGQNGFVRIMEGIADGVTRDDIVLFYDLVVYLLAIVGAVVFYNKCGEWMGRGRGVLVVFFWWAVQIGGRWANDLWEQLTGRRRRGGEEDEVHRRLDQLRRELLHEEADVYAMGV